MLIIFVVPVFLGDIRKTEAIITATKAHAIEVDVVQYISVAKSTTVLPE